MKVLNEKAKHITGVQQWPYRAVSRALEVIPRTLIQNCGGQAIRALTALRVCVVNVLWHLIMSLVTADVARDVSLECFECNASIY